MAKPATKRIYTTCTGSCTWRFDGTSWTVTSSTCSGNCACIDPDQMTTRSIAKAENARTTMSASASNFAAKVEEVKAAHPKEWSFQGTSGATAPPAGGAYASGDQYVLPCYDSKATPQDVPI